jgi:hypothetical protein
MKIKILKNIDIDIDKTRLQEVWPKYLSKNDIFDIEKIESLNDMTVNLVLSDGDILLEVPKNAFVHLAGKNR